MKLGDTARDTITGFQGVVIGETKWLHGCKRLVIQPRELKDGKPIDAQSFDEPQVELVETDVAKTTSGTGGPAGDVPRRADPKVRS